MEVKYLWKALCFSYRWQWYSKPNIQTKHHFFLSRNLLRYTLLDHLPHPRNGACWVLTMNENRFFSWWWYTVQCALSAWLKYIFTIILCLKYTNGKNLNLETLTSVPVWKCDCRKSPEVWYKYECIETNGNCLILQVTRLKRSNIRLIRMWSRKLSLPFRG